VVANVLYKKVCFSNAVEFPYNITSRDWRKSVANDELTSQLNYNKLFLKWRFSYGQKLARVKSVL